ncbi:DNA helicase II [Thiotrichales bacterium 19S9-12]|nr:DNA helicase II [Thiotrichales bacterium 19S9-11]MCF6811892.1 DNA helicase II [Thiotrichales bacterium 19S9-12]
MELLLEGLNEPQKEAVTSENENILVLAGAGSGKTRVLTQRIAYLCQNEGVLPLQILAVTFTNKAANEMRGRIEQLLNINSFGMWIGTFHGIAHRLLRRHGDQIGLDAKFRILDQDEQLQVIKRLIKNMNIDDSFYPPKTIQQFINTRKDEGLRASALQNEKNGRYDHELVRIYYAYELQLKADSALDFADLLLYAYELWKIPNVLEHYQNRFQAILVDEFQDTNEIQYRWLKALTHPLNHMMVVGDDDQSIYGWRGAKVENILKFKREFSPVKVIRLEQNYRSTQTILDVANGIIAHNDQRMGKSLWSAGDKGEKVKLYEASDERDEARFIANKVEDLIQKSNASPSGIAVLYRSNAQSRVIEETLLQKQIPYRIYGGLRFFERAEIKDALAYLRLITFRGDNVAFERIINTPTRGIGLRTLDKIRDIAKVKQINLWQAAVLLSEDESTAARTRNSLTLFVKLINYMDEQLTAQPSLKEKVRFILEASGLITLYKEDKKESARQKLENLEELVNAASEFIPMVSVGLDEDDLLDEFLSFAVLESGEGRADEFSDSVQLMTLHSAKGLEFPYVFIVGLEEGLFPSARSADEDRLAEERRLCYVGITRAMRQLTLSYARIRHQYGDINYQKKSRFVNELPQELVETIRLKTHKPHQQFGFGMVKSINAEDDAFKQGDLVSHHKFGIGVFVKSEGSGEQKRYVIDFKGGYGIKVLLAKMIDLEKI